MDAKKNKSETPVRLEDLLKLKRNEKPGEVFWEKFDNDLKAKTLQALVDEKPSFFMRAIAYMVPAFPVAGLALLIMTLFFSQSKPLYLNSGGSIVAHAPTSPQGDLVERPYLAFSEGPARYIKEEISVELGDEPNLVKVLSSEPIQSISKGVRYVADNGLLASAPLGNNTLY